MTKIEELKGLDPHGRAESMMRLFAKNRNYFKKNYKGFSKLLAKDNTEPYLVNIDADFLTITNTQTGELCHPQMGLDRFAEALGDWTNQAWKDLVGPKLTTHKNYGAYSQFPSRFIEPILREFPGLLFRIQKRTINLPVLPDDQRFSNSVVFFGIFHGLHIDYYLSRTQVCNVAFIEPEVPRFVLSCYFLDYEELHRRFDGLILHIGQDFPKQHVNKFFSKVPITGSVWVRVLPGYATDVVEPLMRQFRLAWRKSDTWVPSEWGIAGMRKTLENITSGKRVWGGSVRLSRGSRVAVVGTGPSLAEDLSWLKKHQDQMIIFAAHSAVSALQNNGINPDFQFNIESQHWSQQVFEKLRLDPEIPIVTQITDEPDKFEKFKEVFMLVETNGIYPVVFNHSIPHLAPTTGNMALSFACRCAPGQLFMFGLDFGFRHVEKTHTDQSHVYQNVESHKSQLGSTQLEVEANFRDELPVYTQPYFNSGRLLVEAAIGKAKGVQVFNCADGAKIHGAKSLRAADIPLSDYNKQQDLAAIKAAFVPQREQKHWQRFSTAGGEHLRILKSIVQELISMKEFDWLNFSQRLDSYATAVYQQLPSTHVSDRRMVPYMELVRELLEAWYVLISFTNNEEEWSRVYQTGHKQLTELLNEMTWDDFLDQ